jgi:hypothetical protein
MSFLILGINNVIVHSPCLITNLSPLEGIYIYMTATRTAILDALSHIVGQLGTQGSPRNKGRSFLKLGVPTPFREDTMR